MVAEVDEGDMESNGKDDSPVVKSSQMFKRHGALELGSESKPSVFNNDVTDISKVTPRDDISIMMDDDVSLDEE